MRISIVTVAFNQAAYVRQAIESVLQQGYPDLEYVVVDPGSTDGTREIIEEYRDRITRIVHRADRGAAEGLNNGFSGVSGNILGFLNSDDLLLPGTLRKVAHIFTENPDLAIIMGNIRIIDGNGDLLRNGYSDRFDRRALAYGACTICQQATFFRPEAFRGAGGFNPANRVDWDGELFDEILKSGARHMVVNEFLGAFRLHDSSITGSRRVKRLHRTELQARFERIMGRPWRPTDKLIRGLYLIRKYMLQPRSFWERLRRGSIMTMDVVKKNKP